MIIYIITTLKAAAACTWQNWAPKTYQFKDKVQDCIVEAEHNHLIRRHHSWPNNQS